MEIRILVSVAFRQRRRGSVVKVVEKAEKRQDPAS
jgi:hypothetical protein